MAAFDALFFREALFPSAIKDIIKAPNKCVLKLLNFEGLCSMLYFSTASKDTKNPEMESVLKYI